MATHNDKAQDKLPNDDEVMLTNPEDRKDTIFSGEGEIPCSVGETKFRGSL